jgi:hypothetical protein
LVVRPAPEGETASHVVVPLTPAAVAENVVVADAVTETDCVGGAAPPAVALKTSEGGVAFKLAVDVDPPPGFITNETGIVLVVPFETIRIEPL